MGSLERKYEVVSTIKHKTIPPKLQTPLSKIRIGEIVSVKNLCEKYVSELVFPNENTAKNNVSRAIKVAFDQKMIVRIDESRVPDWFVKLETISFWQNQLRGAKVKNDKSKYISTTKNQYLLHLWHFNKWLLGKKFTVNLLESNNGKFEVKTSKRKFSNIEELLRFSEQPFMDQKNITRLIKQYLMDEMHSSKRASYMIVIKSAIVSYFEKNDSEIHLKYNPKSKHSAAIDEQEISLSEFLEFLTVGKPSIMEKALFLCKFHRGLDVSTLVDGFNYEAWPQIVKWFGSEDHNNWDYDKCPVPIVLVRIKTEYKHTGFLERDAIDMLCKYLDYRKEKTGSNMKNGEALFLNKMNHPISRSWVFEKFRVMATRSGIQKIVSKNLNTQFNVDSHELRDLLKSTLIDDGCRADVADHVIGHKPKDSYEKQSKLYPAKLRKEYSKASKRINIFTKFSNVVSGTDNVDELKLELNSKIKQADKLLAQQKSQSVTRYQDEFFAQQKDARIDKLEKELEELKKIATTNTTNTSSEMEFCCVNCSIIHDQKQCTSCGSKIRRIFEQKSTN